MRPDIDILIVQLRDGRPATRAEAARTLAEYPSALARQDLVRCLRDLNENVRYWATWALARLGGAKAMDLVAAQLEDALPFELENFTYDFELLSRGKGQNRALVALVEKARLENLLETSTAAGLEPTLVTTATSAVVRFIPGARVRGRWILVHAGNKKATAILAVDNKPLANTTLEIDRGDPRGVATLAKLLDAFDVTVSGNAWTTNAPSVAGPVIAGEREIFDVIVNIPANATAGKK